MLLRLINWEAQVWGAEDNLLVTSFDLQTEKFKAKLWQKQQR